MRNILGTASHETHPFLELTRNISHRFLRRLKTESPKKLSEEFSRTESRLSGALSKLDEFLLNLKIWTRSGTVPGTFRNTKLENQEPNEDRSQDDPHSEVGSSVCQSRHSIELDPDEAPDMVTGLQEEIRYRPHMVTGVQEENFCYPHSVTGFPDEILYCSSGSPSGKHKKGALHKSATISQ